MRDYRLVYPMFAMVLLSASVLVSLFASRTRAIREQRVSARFFRIYQGELEPEHSAKRARHFANLFEAPTLFYAVCLAAMITENSGVAMQSLAWGYVAARGVHAWVHLGRNRLPPRAAAYFSGWAILLAMWVWLALSVARSA